MVRQKGMGQALVLEGRVLYDGEPVGKPGTTVSPDGNIEVIPDKNYVSRGGLKLESAFTDFNLSAKGLNCIDVGSSTGGFTDFLLKNGANKVVAIDVGYGQLSWELRCSPRVLVLERTNIRNLAPERLPFTAEFTVADLSFISLRTVLERLMMITVEKGMILLLFKPQFELKKEKVQEKGIIKDKQLHIESLNGFTVFINRLNLSIEGLTFSKIKGTKGNIEYWFLLTNKAKENNFKYDKMVKDVVEKSHCYFRQNG
jgi:23S rRNA (cytidine1920-2'-O)/16S rRNA (cytidine1409-2'-O)-methyltransferase